MTYPEYFIPSQDFILSLKPGDYVPNCFGNLAEIVEITFRGQDVEGKHFVGYTTRFTQHSTMSGSLKEGRLHRTTRITRKHASWELDDIEAGLIKV